MHAVFVTVQNLVGFYHMQVLIILRVSLEMPIHYPKMVFREYTPNMGSSIKVTPQKAFVCAETRHITYIDR